MSYAFLGLIAVIGLLALIPTRRLFLAGWSSRALLAYFLALVVLGVIVAELRGPARFLVPILVVVYIAPFVTARAGLARLFDGRPAAGRPSWYGRSNSRPFPIPARRRRRRWTAQRPLRDPRRRRPGPDPRSRRPPSRTWPGPSRPQPRQRPGRPQIGSVPTIRRTADEPDGLDRSAEPAVRDVRLWPATSADRIIGLPGERSDPCVRSGETGNVTRALVVHHDASVVERETVVLGEAGYVVDTCPGPAVSPCPVLDDRPCSRAERADVLVYGLDLLADRRTFRRFVDRLRGLYGDKGLVLLSDEELSPALEGEEHELGMRETQRGGPSRGVIHVIGRPTGRTLELAIEEALGAR